MVIPPVGKAVLFLALFPVVFSSCAVKKGCPATASGIGAERILSGDPKAVKAIKRGKKFKA